jgi:ligand-binding sensor domain-containing protein
MRPLLIRLLLGLLPLSGFAQFPYTRVLEVRAGQQRPAIHRLAQDAHGMFWLASDLGLIRTDGERVEVMLRAEQDKVLAIHADGLKVYAAFASGLIVRCSPHSCDTLLLDQELARAPVHAMATDPSGRLWLGTYGAGIRVVENGRMTVLGQADGLRDVHANAVKALPDGRIVVATDQGLAVFTDPSCAPRLLGEPEGVPDNLTLCLAVDDAGMVWVGTDQQGIFRWDPTGSEGIDLLDPKWANGRVVSLAAHQGHVWVGTSGGDVFVYDLQQEGGRYHFRERERSQPVLDMLVDREGAAWWCSASDRIHRADPAILIVPEHEGMDLRGATAIAADPRGRIWFATPDGVHGHATAFTDEHHLARAPMKVDAATPVVTMAASADGTLWAGTFGGGVQAMSDPAAAMPRPHELRKINENVLAVRTAANHTWFATFDGLAEHDAEGRVQLHPLPAPGFVYDVLPLLDGTVLAATDGQGVLLLDPAASRWRQLTSGGTYYSLASDGAGTAWAVGPHTGICRVWPDIGTCVGVQLPPFNGEVHALVWHKGGLLVFGNTGTLAYDPATGSTSDVTARLGLSGMVASLNAVTVDANGSLWIATQQGLLRMRPSPWHLSDRVPMAVTALRSGDAVLPMDGTVHLAHDHERITIRFTAPHYVDPGAVRFEYRMLGLDPRPQITRDRELGFPALPPGRYTFKIRAFAGETAGDAEWIAIPFTVGRPIWLRPWFLVLAAVLLAGSLVLLIRTRDRRLRERERLEREKVRFQLEALRSQVDPHFLFNSFNTLVELIERDPTHAVEHVEQLSLFFRNILLVRDRELVTVEDELELVRNYFALEERRFGSAIRLHVDVDPRDRGLFIVPLTLQLLVENALKHNVATLQQPLVITVSSVDGGLLLHNALQPRRSPPRSTGFGLESIRKRYMALTQRPIRTDAGGGSFTVWIPLITANESAHHRG